MHLKQKESEACVHLYTARFINHIGRRHAEKCASFFPPCNNTISHFKYVLRCCCFSSTSPKPSAIGKCIVFQCSGSENDYNDAFIYIRERACSFPFLFTSLGVWRKKKFFFTSRQLVVGWAQSRKTRGCNLYTAPATFTREHAV